jgi:archaellum component FlaC
MSEEQDTNLEAEDQAAEAEAQASDIGWVPKDEFRGDPAKWVDAKTFLDRGEQILPILRKTNEGLRNDLTSVRGQLTGVEKALKDAQETIEGLQEYHQDDIKQKVEQARRQLLANLKTAKTNEDVDAEVEITDQLTRLNRAESDASTAGDKKIDKTKSGGDNGSTSADPTKNPEFIAWRADNLWYGTDIRRTALADGIAAELRGNNDPLFGKAFLNKVAAEVDKVFRPRPSSSKVEGSRGGAGGTSAGEGKGYDDLPPEAKAACDKFADKLVGPNRLHKDLASWRKQYSSQFFREES